MNEPVESLSHLLTQVVLTRLLIQVSTIRVSEWVRVRRRLIN